jgi:hypothetical protein
MPSWFDDVVKPAYRRWFLNRGIRVETEREVLAHTRTIDLIAELTEEERQGLHGTCFDYLSPVSVVEFKGPRDPLTDGKYSRAMSRLWGLEIEERPDEPESRIVESRAARSEMAAHPGKQGPGKPGPQIRPIDRTLTFVCVTRPTAILNGTSSGYTFERSEEPGVYISRQAPVVRILVPNEMDLIERNYPLMPLARGPKLREFVKRCVQEGRADLLQMSLELGSATGALTVWPEVMEAAEMKSPYTPEVLEVIEKGIQRLPDLPTNKRIRELEEKAQQAEAMLSQAEATAAQAEASAAQAEAMLTRSEVRYLQTALLRLAGRRFGQVSENVARRVEATQDMSQLNSWFDQIADAGALEDTELGSQG